MRRGPRSGKSPDDLPGREAEKTNNNTKQLTKWKIKGDYNNEQLSF
jgi:hypothetical protein